MRLENKNILIISPEAWGDYFVSKHHYAVELASKGNKVYFLNPPSTNFSIQFTKFDKLWELNYPGFPKGLRFYPSFLQKKVILARFRELERIAGVAFDIVWSFDTSVFFDFSFLPDSVLKILHIVDLNQDFQTRLAANSADICFCTTELIRRRLLPFNKNTYKIHHGVRLNNLANVQKPKLPGKGKKKAMYVGNLSMQYLDWGKLLAAAQAHSDVDFVFLGPDGKSNLSFAASTNKEKDILRMLPNAFFLPAVPADQIMGYLLASDVLLISYQEKHYADQASPHKVLEYLASGKPIVATWTEEYAGTN
jgi:glycosyltransferase involved in cell wall biosynthesis